MSSASAQCAANLPSMDNIMDQLQTIGNAVAVLMMVYMGVKWMVSEGPQDRENARRGIIYIVIGLILLRASRELVVYLLCF